MLQFIRSRAQGVISWIIVGLIIIPFALWGINNYQNEVVVSVATVNDVDITQREYQEEYHRERSRLQAMYGEDFDISLLGEQRIKREVLERLVETELLYQKGVEEGLGISDTQLGLAIKSIEAFKGDNGFDSEIYKRALAMQGMSPARFEPYYRRALVVDQLQAGIVNTAFVTANEIEDLAALSGQQRKLSYINISADQFMDKVTVDEAALKSHYDMNQQLYATPEKVSLQYVELTVDGIADSIEITDKEVKEAYEDRLAEFTEEEQRRASHILILVDDEVDDSAARKRATEILARIESGEDFAKLAKEFSQDPGSAELGGDLEFFGRGVMDESFEEVAFSLQKGEVSEPVRSSFGYHLIKLTDIKGGETKPLEAVKKQLKEEIILQKAHDLFLDQAELLANLTYENPDSLEVVTLEMGLPVRKTAMFSRGGGKGIAGNPKVDSAAFSEEVLDEKNNSEVIEISDDYLVVIRIDKHEDSSVLPFEEVKGIISNELRHSEALKLAKLEGEKLLAEIEAGADGRELAEKNGYEWKDEGFVSRDSQNVNRLILEQSFKAEKPLDDKKVVSGVELPGGGYAVIIVSAIKQGEIPERNSAEWQSAEQMQARMHGITALTGYIETLKSEADIIYNEENY